MSVSTRTIADAKAHFAECVRVVEAGGSIVLTRHGRAVARLVPIGEGTSREPDEVAEPSPSYPPAAATPSVASAPRRAALQALLDDHIWPRIPEELLGRGVTKREREEILGYDTATDASDRPPARGRP